MKNLHEITLSGYIVRYAMVYRELMYLIRVLKQHQLLKTIDYSEIDKIADIIKNIAEEQMRN